MLRRDRGSTQADGLLWLLRHITGIATKRNNSPRMFGRLLFWTATDLEMKLIAFRDYYNGLSQSCRTERRNSGCNAGIQRCGSRILSVENALPGFISNAYRSMSTNRQPQVQKKLYALRSFKVVFNGHEPSFLFSKSLPVFYPVNSRGRAES